MIRLLYEKIPLSVIPTPDLMCNEVKSLKIADIEMSHFAWTNRLLRDGQRALATAEDADDSNAQGKR